MGTFYPGIFDSIWWAPDNLRKGYVYTNVGRVALIF